MRKGGGSMADEWKGIGEGGSPIENKGGGRGEGGEGTDCCEGQIVRWIRPWPLRDMRTNIHTEICIIINKCRQSSH